jgi:hypothetical protein
VYAHPKIILGPDGQAEAVEVSYCTLYAHNGAYRVGGLGLITTGAHDGDWEHCTARCEDKKGGGGHREPGAAAWAVQAGTAVRDAANGGRPGR